MVNPLHRYIKSGPGTAFNYEAHLLEKRWPRIKRLLEGKKTPPYEVEIQPTSSCNLHCKWCIGETIQAEHRVLRLPNSLAKEDNMLRVTRSIVDYKVTETYEVKPDDNGARETRRLLQVERVKFSGFIGEPLMAKKATLAGMRHLTDHGVHVGLFTNGVLMDETTWQTILDADFLHLSLDAGTRETFAWLKYNNKTRNNSFFDKIIANITGLAQARARRQGNNLQINAGFIITPYNWHEIFDIAKQLKEMGINTFRVKVDISETLPLSPTLAAKASDFLGEIKVKLVDDQFRLEETHQVQTQPSGSRNFSRCFSQDLWGTIGSNGNVYPCDHTTYPGAPPYGNAVNRPFQEIWEGSQREVITRGLPQICPATCSPFASRVNPFLSELVALYEEHGLEKLEEMRREVLSSNS